MQEQAHIFTPLDDSLTERVKAYQRVYKANSQAKASLEVSPDSDLMDALGEVAEVQDAVKIMQYSMRVASEAFQQQEIEMIAQQELLEPSQLEKLKQLKLLKEFEALSEEESQSHKHKQSRKL